MKSPPLHHVALRTRDVQRSKAFYREVVGLSASLRARAPGEAAPEDQGEAEADRVWLDAGPTVLMIEAAGEDEAAPGAGSLDLLAFATPSLAEGEARCARAGVTIEARTEFTLYIRDPDGRRVGLSVYDFDAVEPAS